MKLVDKDLVELAFAENGLLSKQFDGYKVREQQVELAKTIQKSIKEKKPLLGEAPTGVGKSLAALIPAFEVIVKEDKPVVVVTSSIILQEQYINKDIPLLEKLFQIDTGAVLIKGRNNYVCKVKEKDVKGGNFSNHSNKYQKEFLDVMEWSGKTRTGDKSELDFNPAYPVWSQFATMESHECTGKQCPLYSTCHYYKKRRGIDSSKLIVCNYHYFFTALDVPGMLPDDIEVVIMDEGHEIAAIARDFQQQKYNTGSFSKIVDNFLKAYKSLESTREGAKAMELIQDIELDLVQSSLTDMIFNLTKFFLANKRSHLSNIIFNKTDRQELQKYAKPHLDQLTETRSTISNYLEFKGLDQNARHYWEDMHTTEEIRWQIAIENLDDSLSEKARFIEKYFLFEHADLLFGGTVAPEEDRVETVYWIEGYKDNETSLIFKPTSGANLTESLFEGGITPIVLSATLSANKAFDHLKKDLGISGEVNELIVGSPFDLTDNLLWYLPKGIPAGNAQEHQTEMLKEMEGIINLLDGRSLCLFTSNRNLEWATKYFRKVLPKHIEVISQTEVTKQKIIETIKKNPNVVITATRSFFTGVDIQGQNLSAVMIDKLPFPMVGDPVNDYLISKAGGFWSFSLPDTIISLKQGFGRLNRTSEDKGIVALFDGRLSSAGYKDHIFNSFDFKITATREKETLQKYIDDLNL